jgi:K+-sensing histidine kinase KdpD
MVTETIKNHIGIIKTANEMNDEKYLVYDQNNVLKYVIDKTNVDIKEQDAIVLMIRESSVVEQAHTKSTEVKYKKLMLSTITHDLKSPITAIQGHLSLLPDYVTEKGLKYLRSAQAAALAFEYYIYDLVVLIQFTYL